MPQFGHNGAAIRAVLHSHFATNLHYTNPYPKVFAGGNKSEESPIGLDKLAKGEAMQAQWSYKSVSVVLSPRRQ